MICRPEKAERFIDKKPRLYILLICALLLTGCGKTDQGGTESRKADIGSISVSGLSESCVFPDGGYLFCTLKGSSSIYQYTTDGKKVAEFQVTADDAKEKVMEFAGEEPENAAALTGLCIRDDVVYCCRVLKGTLLSVNIKTGEEKICGEIKEIADVEKMAAGEHVLFILGRTEWERKLWTFDISSGELETIPVNNVVTFAYVREDTCWIELYDDEGEYCFQRYDAGTGTLSEKYAGNFTGELSDMVYAEAEGAIYGHLLADQYVRIDPQNPKVAARFSAQQLYAGDSCMQSVGDTLYVQDAGEEKIYSFPPAAFVVDNKPLKGYTTVLSDIPDWEGYNIELEVIPWDELALKVLAGDSDYDFVIMNTNMAETTAIRDAMAYAPIPEECIEKYWEQCYPFIREAATHEGDIWMVPLNLNARGLVYNENNLKQYGIRVDEITDMEGLCAAAKKLYEEGKTGEYGLLYPVENLLKEYIWKEQGEEKFSFDTEEFAALLDFMTGEYGVSAPFRNSSVAMYAWDYPAVENDGTLTVSELYEKQRKAYVERFYLEEVRGTNWDYEKYLGADGFHVCPVPGISGENPAVQVSADILIINPNAPDPEGVLKYVTDMSETYIANYRRHLSADQNIYPKDGYSRELFDLYARGNIVFGLPKGLFDIYYRYCEGTELNRETVVTELDRKVSMYFGE